MIDASFVEKIADLATTAAREPVLTVDAEPKDVYFLLDGDGNYKRHVAQPKPEAHKPGSLEAVADLADSYAVSAQIFYSRRDVTLLYDEYSRRDRATLPLAMSPQILKLQEWERHRAGMTQAQLIAAMKETFPDNIEGVGVVEMIRRIKISVNTAQDQTKTARSIGKAAEASFGAGNEIPDFIKFTVPVFANGSLSGVRASVQCSFDMDPSSGAATFRIVPCAGEVEAAVTSGERQIGDRLADLLAAREVKTVGVFYGAEA